jgi:DNA-binding CsgD family transcriptional regulator
MSGGISDGIFVILCDWHGHCIWKSNENLRVKVGEFVWQHLTPESQEKLKPLVANVVALREQCQTEVQADNGHLLQAWLWPLNSPEVAVCVLTMRIPGELARLTERERDCLVLLAQGLETSLIAHQMEISMSMVHTLVRRAREKLGLSTVDALRSFAARFSYPANMPLNEATSTDPKRLDPR